MSNDIVRFMDENKITMASIGGHGFGAKVATATAISNHNRFTGVICLDGGPLDHTYYESYQELVSYVEACRNMKIENMNGAEALKKVSHISSLIDLNFLCRSLTASLIPSGDKSSSRTS
jgi:pimeloyl-ACP methyl ester carboxylesterase